MRYQGGKAKIAEDISGVLKYFRESGQTYLEPFLGAASVFSRMAEPKIGSDLSFDLILLWSALKSGWTPPATLSRAEYDELKNYPASALKSFAGFGLSFGGKWFGGYADSRVDAGQAARGLARRAAHMNRSRLVCCSYDSWRPSGMLIYCDPPYQGTTAYPGQGQFDCGLFWSTMREWSKSNTVFISEFSAPVDFLCVWERARGVYWRYGQAERVRPSEKLFMWNGS